MMTSMISVSDTDLVSESLSGNRDAFGQIIARYQSLICSLAFSATGSLSQSEDLAQETFVTAWKQLPNLNEREKLRSWLCGIARNLINNSLRKQGHEPSHCAESLENISESHHSPEPLPHDQTISNEEQAILWRSLERIPEIYREPLVLFYREHQSVEAVAQNLELTEDAVKQRLSRGRKLLHEQVLAFVEGALARTNPGQAFTLGVLAALPVMITTSAKAATLGAAAKGSAAATGATFASVLGLLAGPALGLLGGYFGIKMSLNSTRTPRERALVIRYSKIIAIAVFIFTASLLLFCFMSGSLWKTHPVWIIGLGIGITLAYGTFIFYSTWRFNREFARIRTEERKFHPEAFDRPDTGHLFTTPWEYRSRAKLFGLPLVHCRSGKLPGQKKLQPAIGWIACGEIAYGVLLANGGVAVGGISFGGVSVGIFSFGGFSLGLLAFGGIAFGGIAMGGAAIGMIASGGFAIAWHAATGGLALAHDIAIGGGALAKHANDAVGREFLQRYYWLDTSQAGPRNTFWVVCFAPTLLQVLFWNWLRRKIQNRPPQN